MRVALAADLVHSPKVKIVVLAGATHFVHLDRPERGRGTLLTAVDAFVPR
ncbi:MAG TPA: hypothetical protein VKZ53_21290 [Candidatus Angelobacter sp.]|nr:hypothetical protein [Candidatus Angelobacter sp.]